MHFQEVFVYDIFPCCQYQCSAQENQIAFGIRQIIIFTRLNKNISKLNFEDKAPSGKPYQMNLMNIILSTLVIL